MRFEVELTLADKQFKYAISFEMPNSFREAHVCRREFSPLMDTAYFHASSAGQSGGAGQHSEWIGTLLRYP